LKIIEKNRNRSDKNVAVHGTHKNTENILFPTKFERTKGHDIDISGCMFDVSSNSGLTVARLLAVSVLTLD